MGFVKEFILKDCEFIELHRLLKATGLCDSGGIAKALIAEGCVQVDGRVELRKPCKIRQGQTVEFAGRTIAVV